MILDRSGSVPAPIAMLFYLLKGESRVVRFFRTVLDRSAIDAGPGSFAGSARFPLGHAVILFKLNENERA
jgi:hypothetical protein